MYKGATGVYRGPLLRRRNGKAGFELATVKMISWMKEKRPRRDRWLTIRLSDAEASLLLKYARQTTCRSLSEYTRSVLLMAPVTVWYRNASADAFLEEMVRMKRELHTIAGTFYYVPSQPQKQEPSTGIRLDVLAAIDQRAQLLQKTDQILRKAEQIYQLWSQK